MSGNSVALQIYCEKALQLHLSKNEVFHLRPPFFLFVKSGSILIQGEKEDILKKSTLTVVSKNIAFNIFDLSEDAECILLQYDLQYLRTMSFQLNLLDAFKYIYRNTKYTFSLSNHDFEDLWFLAQYIFRQTRNVHNFDLEKLILRHLNYSFLYSTIEKMDRNFEVEANPINQKEKIVLGFFRNLQNNTSQKLNVAEYAKMQNVTARHLSTTVKNVTGMTALELIHRSILRRAKTKLTTSHIPISEIAMELGYNDPYAFSHFFKKQTGNNPSDFRNKYLE